MPPEATAKGEMIMGRAAQPDPGQPEVPFTMARPFDGVIRIEDGDHSGNIWQWHGKFKCRRCGGHGVQTLTAKKEYFPERMPDREVVEHMTNLVSKNHRCPIVGPHWTEQNGIVRPISTAPAIMEEKFDKDMPSC